MTYDTLLAQAAYALADRWDAVRSTADITEFKKTDLDEFNSNQISMLLIYVLARFLLIPSIHSCFSGAPPGHARTSSIAHHPPRQFVRAL
jgi:leukotriene-A4 hydrolase